MSPELVQMLQGMIDEANNMRDAAQSLGASFIPMLPFKVGDVIPYHSQATMRVHRVTFELHAYMRGGVWRPGYAAIGPQMIGSTTGSTSCRAIFNLDGTRAVLTA